MRSATRSLHPLVRLAAAAGSGSGLPCSAALPQPLPPHQATAAAASALPALGTVGAPLAGALPGGARHASWASALPAVVGSAAGCAAEWALPGSGVFAGIAAFIAVAGAMSSLDNACEPVEKAKRWLTREGEGGGADEDLSRLQDKHTELEVELKKATAATAWRRAPPQELLAAAKEALGPLGFDPLSFNIAVGDSMTRGAAADVDHTQECTRQLRRYDLKENAVALWDVPGGDTANHPGASYVQDKHLAAFDMLLLVVNERVTEMHANIMLASLSKFPHQKVLLVYPKADDRIRSMRNSDPGLEEATAVRRIQEAAVRGIEAALESLVRKGELDRSTLDRRRTADGGVLPLSPDHVFVMSNHLMAATLGKEASGGAKRTRAWPGLGRGQGGAKQQAAALGLQPAGPVFKEGKRLMVAISGGMVAAASALQKP